MQRCRSSGAAARGGRPRGGVARRRLGAANFGSGASASSPSAVRTPRARLGALAVAVAHVAQPGVEHVADIDLARRVHAAAAAVRVGQVALIAAADLQPFGALAGKPHVDAVVDFEVVGQDQRAGAVDDVGEADGVPKHLLRRALEAEVVGVHHGAVHRDRMHHAKLLELAHQRHVRIDVGVPAPHFEDALGFLLALLLLQRVEVVAEHRVLQRGDELGIVVVVAEIAVTVRIGPDADLRFPEAVGRAVLAHLADRDLARAVGMHIVGLRLRRLDRGAVREERMRGVAQILEIDLPVAVIGVLEHAARRLDLAVGRAVDHVVERLVMWPSDSSRSGPSAASLAKTKPR